MDHQVWKTSGEKSAGPKRRTGPNPKLIALYEKRSKNVEAILKELRQKLKKHAKKFKDSGERDWGYAGDLGYLEERVKDANNFFLE